MNDVASWVHAALMLVRRLLIKDWKAATAPARPCGMPRWVSWLHWSICLTDCIIRLTNMSNIPEVGFGI